MQNEQPFPDGFWKHTCQNYPLLVYAMPILFGIGIISKDSVIIQGHLHPCTPSVSGVLLECIRKNKDRQDKAGWNQYQVSILRLNTRIQYLNSPRTSGRRRHHVHVCNLQDKRSLLRAQSGSGIFLSGIRDSHAEEFSDSVPYEGNPHTSLCPDRHGVCVQRFSSLL